MPRTLAELARNRLQAALDEYDETGPPATIRDMAVYVRWETETAARLGCSRADAIRIWRATMLGTITQAARTYLEETAP